jgi:murein DD-endopeptidase MepM/ murein hydrolase activator NlpD
VVKIDHGRGYVSLYAHQSRIKVRKGSYVKKGEVIGYVGSTGRSTGPHLHFGLYKNGRAINPLKVLKYSGSSGGAVRTASERYRKMKKYTMVKIRKIPIKGARLLKKQLNGLLKKNISAAYRWEEFKNSSTRLWDRKHYETREKCRWAAN